VSEEELLSNWGGKITEKEGTPEHLPNRMDNIYGKHQRNYIRASDKRYGSQQRKKRGIRPKGGGEEKKGGDL